MGDAGGKFSGRFTGPQERLWGKSPSFCFFFLGKQEKESPAASGKKIIL